MNFILVRGRAVSAQSVKCNSEPEKKKQKLATAGKVDLNLFLFRFVSFIQNRIIWHPLCVSQCIVLSVHNGFVANMSEGDVDVERFIETKQPRKVSIKWNWSWPIERKLSRRIYILIESRLDALMSHLGACTVHGESGRRWNEKCMHFVFERTPFQRHIHLEWMRVQKKAIKRTISTQPHKTKNL